MYHLFWQGLQLVKIPEWKEKEMFKGLEQCADEHGYLAEENFRTWWETWDF